MGDSHADVAYDVDLQIKPGINKQTAAYNAQQEGFAHCMLVDASIRSRPAGSQIKLSRRTQMITKKIVKKIEQTMAARASTDGAGLSILHNKDGDESNPRPLLKAPVLSQRKDKKAAKRP